jgi:hypothetical protein
MTAKIMEGIENNAVIGMRRMSGPARLSGPI